MASVSMTSSFLGGATTTLSERSPATTIHRRVVITNGAKRPLFAPSRALPWRKG
ncbi:hypothetical protein CsSME_00011703 [Camellia sinensis var. sinensis]